MAQRFNYFVTTHQTEDPDKKGGYTCHTEIWRTPIGYGLLDGYAEALLDNGRWGFPSDGFFTRVSSDTKPKKFGRTGVGAMRILNKRLGIISQYKIRKT